jgi:hypothetical protein
MDNYYTYGMAHNSIIQQSAGRYQDKRKEIARNQVGKNVRGQTEETGDLSSVGLCTIDKVLEDVDQM